MLAVRRRWFTANGRWYEPLERLLRLLSWWQRCRQGDVRALVGLARPKPVVAQAELLLSAPVGQQLLRTRLDSAILDGRAMRLSDHRSPARRSSTASSERATRSAALRLRAVARRRVLSCGADA